MQIRVNDFNLSSTLESGQVFGFTKAGDGAYEGVIGQAPVRLWQKNGTLFAQGIGKAERLREYFDLDRDLTPLYALLRAEAPLENLPVKLAGLRLIRQDPWEALACFILSSNNNVKRIQGIWKNLSFHFNRGRCFPTPGQIAQTHERILRQLGLGYRAPFLWASARFVAASPQSLDVIRRAHYEEAKRRVLAFPGIGPKVADCVLLYGFQKYEAFPVDVWIGRVMRKIYFRNRKISEARIRRFGQRQWGNLAGYVQQYLFHGARMGILS